MIELIMKYKHLILYLFFGVCTTIINLVSYYLFAHTLSMSTLISTILAWLIAVIVAYITNKLWVFECKSWEPKLVLREAGSFFACRIFTGILDIVIMLIFVDVLLFNDLVIKFVSNILVITLNYIASKLIVFKSTEI